MNLLNLGMTGGYVSPPPPPPAVMALGTNVQQTAYSYGHTPLIDISNGGRWQTDGVNTPVDHSLYPVDLGSDGYPHAMPSGATYVDRSCMTAPAAEDYDFYWTGTGMSGLTINNGTIVSGPTYSGSRGHIVFSYPSARILGTKNATVSVRYNISDPANYPRDFTVTPTAWNGTDVFQPTWLSQITNTTVSNGWLRPMDCTAVNRNLGYDKNWLTHSNQVTAATRQLETSGAWVVSNGDWDAYYTDGMPIEVGIKMANEANRNLWWTLHPNGSQDYYEALVDAVLANPASGGLDADLTIGFEVSNEPWNNGFPIAQQLRGMSTHYGLTQVNSATPPKLFIGSISGTTLTVETWVSGSPLAVNDPITTPDDGKDTDYGVVKIASFGTGTGGVGTYTLNAALVRNATSEPSGTRMSVGTGGEPAMQAFKFIQIMQWIKARWDANARADKPTMKRIFAWQNAAGGGWATSILNYAPTGHYISEIGGAPGVAVKDVCDVYAVAPYVGPTSVGSDVIPYTSHTVAEIIQQMTDRLPTVLGWLAGCKSAAEALGVELWCYEGGPSVYLKDTDFVNSIDHDPGMYDFVLNYLTQVEATIGSKPFCWYLNTSTDSAWGATDYTGQTISLANCPKAKALQDFAAGARA